MVQGIGILHRKIAMLPIFFASSFSLVWLAVQFWHGINSTAYVNWCSVKNAQKNWHLSRLDYIPFLDTINDFWVGSRSQTVVEVRFDTKYQPLTVAMHIPSLPTLDMVCNHHTFGPREQGLSAIDKKVPSSN